MSQQDSLFQEPRDTSGNQATSASPSSGANSPGDLAEQVKSLQYQFSTLLILLLVVSGTFTAYLYPQVIMARKELEALRPQAQRVMSEYNQRVAPRVQQFINRLGEYSKDHPDVLPIMARYGLTKPAALPGTGTNALPVAPAVTQ